MIHSRMSLNYTMQCINASAGSGKTTLLVKQIMEKAKRTMSFENILCLTFSNAAAQELMKRVYTMNLELENQYTWNNKLSQTIHAFCLNLLKAQNTHYQVITPQMHNMLWNKSLDDCIEKFSEAKLNYTQLRQLAIYKPIEQIHESLKPYYEMIQQRFTYYKSFESLISFDEIISLAHSMIEKDLLNEALCGNLAGIYHLYIDECQDLSTRQWEIVNYIINEIIQIHELEVILVGDKMQSIYSFQGANPKSFDIFQEVHQEIHKTNRSQGFLQQNMLHSYRCGKNVTKLVNAIFDLKQVSKSRTQDNIEFWEPSADWQDRICEKISMLLKLDRQTDNNITPKVKQHENLIKPDDIIILIRKRNPKYNLLVEKLESIGINVAYDEHKTIFKNILLILKRVTEQELDLKTQDELILSHEQINSIKQWISNPMIIVKHITEALSLSESIIGAILHNLGNYFTSQGSTLQSCIAFFEQTPNIELNASDQVKIQTIHATKGQESKIVFLCDTMQNPNFSTVEVNEGTDRETAKQAALEEYKRLLYVALTRAKEQLIIVNNPETYKISDESWYQLIKDGFAKIQQLNE